MMRLPTGIYIYEQRERPTPEELKEASQAAQSANFEKDGFKAHCPACKKCYQTPSEFTHIREHGCCNYCIRFVRGEEEYTVASRMPTLQEAIEAKHPGVHDLDVLREAARAYLEVCKE